MQAWLSNTLMRIYPSTPAPAAAATTLMLDVARGERASLQVAVRTEEQAEAIHAEAVAPVGVEISLRRIGYVPQPHANTETPLAELDGRGHTPGYVPDPLLPETTVQAGPWETHAFWVTVRVPAEVPPGTYPVQITLTAGEETITLTATVVAHHAVLPPRRNFPVTHWFYADALLDWYQFAPFEERFWSVLDRYFADLAAHGQDTIYVPIFTPPLDGVKRPTQLLHVQRDGEVYQFDWSLVRRWVQAARAQGITHFEWTHLFTQWGVQHAIRIYEGRGEQEQLLWPPETEATSATYRDFLRQFLPAFEQFLREEHLLECSFFHLSDEPHGTEHLANYRAARELLRELAPWMRVMDALSEINFAREGLTDIPVPIITTAPEFINAGFPAWAYFCCGPRACYLNRLLDTPLTKIRMSGWLFYRLRAQGFLHWGYNYWYARQSRELIDPFTVTDAHAWPEWAYGDTFVVYPGPDGPIDSLRWEVFAESLQEYALLQAAGIDADDPLLGDIHDYADFPRDPAWILARRAELLRRLDGVAVG